MHSKVSIFMHTFVDCGKATKKTMENFERESTSRKVLLLQLKKTAAANVIAC